MENKEYLAHHGVKGQQWGKRQWQYEDGSLTPAGREHYGYGDGKKRSSSDDAKEKIKMIREQNRAQIKIEKARAKAERAMAKTQNRERMRYEHDLQKQKLKLDKIKSKEREKRSKEYEARKAKQEQERQMELERQRKQIAEFKKKHPLKYNQLKKYLKEDGTLNDAGRARFFGDGTKKKMSQMSTEDLIKTTSRLYAEKNYNQAKYELQRSDPNYRAKQAALKMARDSGMTFVSKFAAESFKSLNIGGKEGFKSDLAKNGKAAVMTTLDVMGSQLSRRMGQRNNILNNYTGYWKILSGGDVITIDNRTGEIVRKEPQEYYARNNRR